MPNIPLDQEVTAGNVTALILKVLKDPESIMNTDEGKYELKMLESQGKWRDKEHRHQEATFMITGEISDEAHLGLYWDRTCKFINVC